MLRLLDVRRASPQEAQNSDHRSRLPSLNWDPFLGRRVPLLGLGPRGLLVHDFWFGRCW
jgi:hypothetical protein